MPKISVVMPVYNGEKYLREAMDSILGQTYTDFEFIIIDDGSKDSSAEIVRSYDDPRIRFYQNEQNMGVAATLNRGLDLATGEYIARMDANDISLPERFAKQVTYMDAHPDVAVCGSNLTVFSDAAPDRLFCYSEKDGQIRADLVFNSAFAHPSVIMRGQIIRDNHIRYNCQYEKAEDYELWYRLLKVGKGYNVQRPLLRYRHHASQVTKTYSDVKDSAVDRIHREMLRDMGANLTPLEYEVFSKICGGQRQFEQSEYDVFVTGGKRVLNSMGCGKSALRRTYSMLNCTIVLESSINKKSCFSWWDLAISVRRLIRSKLK